MFSQRANSLLLEKMLEQMIYMSSQMCIKLHLGHIVDSYSVIYNIKSEKILISGLGTNWFGMKFNLC